MERFKNFQSNVFTNIIIGFYWQNNITCRIPQDNILDIHKTFLLKNLYTRALNDYHMLNILKMYIEMHVGFEYTYAQEFSEL